MNLHNIKTEISNWVWLFARGGNNRPIGRNPRGTHLSHIYLMERGQPPAREGFARQNWAPYQDSLGGFGPGQPERNLERLKNTLCGGIPTKARWARLDAQAHWGYRRGQCGKCAEIAVARGITVHTIGDLVQADPWHNVEWDTRRQLGTDPVTRI